MNQAEINTIWLRWLDQRSLPEGAVEQLVDHLESDDVLKERLLTDLEMHRQLQACGQVPSDDFSFVARMLVSFESNYAQTTPVSGRSPKIATPRILDRIRPANGNAVSTEPQPSNATAYANREAPTAVTIVSSAASQPGGLLVERSPSASDRRVSPPRRYWVLALCLPLLAAMLWASFELGRRTQPTPSATVNGNQAASRTPAVKPSRALNPSADVDDRLANASGDSASGQPLESGDTVESNTAAAHEIDQQGDQQGDQQSIAKASQGDQADTKQQIARSVKDRGGSPTEGSALTEMDTDRLWATIVNEQDAVWTQRPDPGSAEAPQVFQLDAGSATVELAVGGQVTFRGPAKFELGPAIMQIEQGDLAFVLPDLQAETFTILAANNRIQLDGIARFDLHVEPTGSANLALQRGAVHVDPWFGQRNASPMSLTTDGFDHLEIPGDAGGVPTLARLSGADERFEGWVNYQGRVLKLQDPALVQELWQRAQQRFHESPELLTREWSALIRAVNPDSQPPQFAPPAQRFQIPEMELEPFREMRERLREMMERGGQSGFPFPSGTAQGQFQFHFETDEQGNLMPAFPQTDSTLPGSLGVFADLLKRLQQ